MEITGASATVTGASRGLGERLVHELLAKGARRVYAAARATDSIEAVVALDPALVEPLVLDVNDADQTSAPAEVAADVSLVFNNAGVMVFGTPIVADLGQLERAITTNYVGMLRVTRAFTPVLEANGGGTFVNIVSLVALAPITGMSAYCASKAATHSMTQALRHELSGRGIAVLGVYPGAMNTDMMAGVDAPKAEPDDAGHVILDGVEAGTEYITPDQFSADAYNTWCSDPRPGDSARGLLEIGPH